MIPLLAFVFVPTSIAVAGDTEQFLERAAKIQFGIMVCAYCLSHAPAWLLLEIPGFEGHNARLLLDPFLPPLPPSQHFIGAGRLLGSAVQKSSRCQKFRIQ
jgi:hypothetical protein